MSVSAKEKAARKKKLEKAKKLLQKRKKDFELIKLGKAAASFREDERKKYGDEYVQNFMNMVNKKSVEDVKEDLEEEIFETSHLSSKYRAPGRKNELSFALFDDNSWREEKKVETRDKMIQTEEIMFEAYLLDEFGDDFLIENITNYDEVNASSKIQNKKEELNNPSEVDEINIKEENKKEYEIPSKVWSVLMESPFAIAWPPLITDETLNEQNKDSQEEEEDYVDETEFEEKKQIDPLENITLLDKKDAEITISSGDFLNSFVEKSKFMERALGIYANTMEDYVDLVNEATEELSRLIDEKELNDVDDSTTKGLNMIQKHSKKKTNKKLLNVLKKNKDESKAWLKKKNTYKFNLTGGRSITSIDFCKTNKDWFLSSYASKYENGYPAYTEGSNGMINIWNTILPTYPDYTLTGDAMITSAMFHPRNPKLIFGSTFNGQILQWDVRAKTQPIMQSKFSTGHSSPVFAMNFLPTVNSRVHHILSVSNDGRLCTWREGDNQNRLDNKGKVIDNYNRFEPNNDVILKTDESGVRQIDIAPVCFGYPYKDANSLVLGSDEGSLYKIDNYQQANNTLQIKNTILNAHSGPITNISFFPFYYYGDNSNKKLPDTISQLYLTSSFDWSVKLWNLKTDTITNKNNKQLNNIDVNDITNSSNIRPLSALSTNSASNSTNQTSNPNYICEYNSFTDYVYDVNWSNGKPGVFATADGEGKVSLFNLTKDFKEPIYTEQITKNKEALTKVEFGLNGRLLCTGDSHGSLTLFSVHRQLCGSKDKKDFNDFEDAVKTSIEVQ